MGSTNYTGTFIQVAEDCPTEAAEQPPVGSKTLSVTALQYALISQHPYEYTSDDILFEVYAIRHAISTESRSEARETFFAKDQACLRASPLSKRYGWGIHHDAESRIALVPFDSDEYRSFATDSSVKQLRAMRSKRA